MRWWMTTRAGYWQVVTAFSSSTVAPNRDQNTRCTRRPSRQNGPKRWPIPSISTSSTRDGMPCACACWRIAVTQCRARARRWSPCRALIISLLRKTSLSVSSVPSSTVIGTRKYCSGLNARSGRRFVGRIPKGNLREVSGKVYQRAPAITALATRWGCAIR